MKTLPLSGIMKHSSCNMTAVWWQVTSQMNSPGDYDPQLQLSLERKALSSLEPLTLLDLPWPSSDLQVSSGVMEEPSTGWRGHLVVVGAFEEDGVADAHLERSVAGEVWGTASTGPGLWVEELARVAGAVAETRAVEAGVVRLVDLLCCVALHEQVDGHDTRTLQHTCQCFSSTCTWR